MARSVLHTPSTPGAEAGKGPKLQLPPAAAPSHKLLHTPCWLRSTEDAVIPRRLDAEWPCGSRGHLRSWVTQDDPKN